LYWAILIDAEAPVARPIPSDEAMPDRRYLPLDSELSLGAMHKL